MSDWINPALESKKLRSGFTAINWCLDDRRNTCKICPCIWSKPPHFYTHFAQPCGSPFLAIASTADGIKCQTHGEYYEIVSPDHANDPIVPIYEPPIPVQPTPVSIEVWKNSTGDRTIYEGGWTLVETIPWFDLGPGTTTAFWGTKRPVFTVGPPSHPAPVETYLGSYWQSTQIIDPFDLILASKDNPYPNGTYDLIYSDSSGVYDHYIAWVEGEIPTDFPEVLTQFYLVTKPGYYTEPSGITFGGWDTNYSQTDTSAMAVYGRVECSYAREDAGLPPFLPFPD